MNMERFRIVEQGGSRLVGSPCGTKLLPLTDAGRRLRARMQFTTGPPPEHQPQTFLRESPWSWGTRVDSFELVTPNRGDPGKSDFDQWLRTAAILGECTDAAARDGLLDALRIESAAQWYPVAPRSRLADYWHLVMHVLAWEGRIGTSAQLTWRIASTDPLEVLAISELNGTLASASEEAALLIEWAAKSPDADYGPPVPAYADRLTPLMRPQEILHAARSGSIARDLPPFAPDGFVGQILAERPGGWPVPAAAAPAKRRPPEQLIIADFSVWQGDREMNLGNTLPFKIFKKLYEERGRAVPFVEIASAAWGDRSRNRSDSIHQHVSKLKSKLEEAGIRGVSITSSAAKYYTLSLQLEESEK